MEVDERLGYLIAKLEEIGTEQKSLVLKVDALEARVNEKFTKVETVFKTVKYIGLVLIAILTFKFGDLPGIWSRLFG